MALEKLIPVGKLAFAYELGIAQRNELISTVGASLNLEQYKERDVKLLSKLPIATLWDGEHFEDNVLRKAIEQELTNPQGLFELIEELCDNVTFWGTNIDYVFELSMLREMLNQYDSLNSLADEYGHDSFPPGSIKVYISGNGYDETDFYDVQFTSFYINIGATPERTFTRNINVARECLISKIYSIICDNLYDMLLIDKDKSIIFIDSIGYKILEDTDELSKEYVQSVLDNQAIKIKSEKNRKVFSHLQNSKTIQGIPRVELKFWRIALEEYKQLPGLRENDALPKRMDALLLRLEGKSPAEIKKLYPDDNFSRMIRDAQNKDVKKLMGMNPTLPKLPPLTSAK